MLGTLLIVWDSRSVEIRKQCDREHSEKSTVWRGGGKHLPLKFSRIDIEIYMH